jgi:hypothetical protein
MAGDEYRALVRYSFSAKEHACAIGYVTLERPLPGRTSHERCESHEKRTYVKCHHLRSVFT